MSLVCANSVIHSTTTGEVQRASSIGATRTGPMVSLETLWLPKLFFSGEMWVETFAGWLQAKDIGADHWLRVTKPIQELQVPEVPERLHFEGSIAYQWYYALRRTQPVSIIDMMQCEDHIAEWRKDVLLVSPRKLEPWYSSMVRDDRGSWWMRVLEARTGFSRGVSITGQWEVYGVPVAA